ncbi:iron uptake transporter permease EfeU [Luteimicrobium sp. DT211]|uniref:iron uptake transporter permease EfeU n=1 Tax=Luteimicrobium sp. DT211 TaxID=3393412 RepID=UPI003CF0802D
MLATFVIGLREGLEAALVVGILAAFLKRNGASMRPLWWGIGAAVLLSVGVGVTLEVVSTSLPQRAQEGMETVISAVAVVFVTTMIVWMSAHARGLKKELEASAGAALKDGTAWAVAGMAFLAIVKEGFETSVFLLATFQASTSTTAAVVGAALGIVVSAGLGVGLYQGGIRFNIGRFFQVTGVFLVFVAAGLVVTTLRTAHEAGWLTVGQGRTVDLTWLAPAGSVQAALLTGVLGIPTEPRVVEVVAWFAYLVPMLAFVLWPAKRRLKGAAAMRFELGLAGGLAAAALALALLVPAVGPYPGGANVPVVASADDPTPVGVAGIGTDGRAVGALDRQGRIMGTAGFGDAQGAATTVDGVAATEKQVTEDLPTTDLPTTVTLAQLTEYGGGRVPVGIDPTTAPGPYTASWKQTQAFDVVETGNHVLLRATQTTRTVLTVTGGGLAASRTVTVAPAAAGITDWTVAPDQVAATAAAVVARDRAAHERALWRVYLPIVLAVAAAALAAAGLRRRRALARAADPAASSAAPSLAPAPSQAPDAALRVQNT